MKAPKDGQKLRLNQKRGDDEAGIPQSRVIEGTVRVFQQEGKTRYELVEVPPTEVPCGTCNGAGTFLVGGIAHGFTLDTVEEAD
jgi:hypothetical protein